VHNHRLTPWHSLYRDFCDAISDPVLRQIALKFCANYLSKIHNMARERVMSVALDPIRRESLLALDEIRIKDENVGESS
jgi:hypothetical protein